MPNVLLAFLLIVSAATAFASAQAKPNILLIVVDDLGYTDLGSFGGEIETPNLDKLAYQGTRLTNFYTATTCSPTRAMMLTGVDNHMVGLGNMQEELSPNQKGKPGYEGYLNSRAANLAEVLKNAGYKTYMTGKWHLGLEADQSPAARGFDQSYALLNGGGGHFDNLGMFTKPAQYRENGKRVRLPEDFYSTRFYTEKLIDYIESGREDGQPFFGYLAYTAVHWPLQAPATSIAKYEGRYDLGYDQLHQQRIQNAIEREVLPAGSLPVPRLKGEPAWHQLSAEERRVEARKMEIYAAMLDDVDTYVGKLIDYLKSIGELDNTVIFLMSDNGAEGHDLEHGLEFLAPWVEQCCDNSFDNMGNADSYLFTGPNWTRASVGSAKHYKGFTSEGGIKAPAFIRIPQQDAQQSLLHRFITVKDVMPSLLELAGVPEPKGQFAGRDILPITGQSFLRSDDQNTNSMGWELMGKRGYRYGDWKIIHLPKPYGTGQWQLYNLSQDPREQQDLATKEPDKLAEMVGRWEQYAKTNGVILPDWVSGY